MESEEYNGLISPDAYEYLDTTPPEDLLSDPLLEEQEELSDAFDGIDDDEFLEEEEVYDDSAMYSYSSLFDEADEEEAEAAQAAAEPEPEPEIHTSYYEHEDFGDEEGTDVLHGILRDIVALLPSNSATASYLRECDRIQREKITEALESAVEAWRKDGRDKMFTIPGTSISVGVVTPSEDPMTETQRLQSIAAVMVAKGAHRWTALFLSAEDSGRIIAARLREVSQQDFTQWQWKTVTMLAGRLKSRI